jgi:hypothetical protein
MRALAFLLAAVACLSGSAPAQGVMVAPHAVYIDHRTRSTQIELYNPGADPVEVAVSSFFAYAGTDSLGEFTLIVPDSTAPGRPSAAEWIEAFPRRVTMAPLQRQTVRLLARPPQDLPDGEYWARLVITAKGGTLPVSRTDSAPNITVGLALEVRTVVPLTYRKGTLTTGVAVSTIRTETAGDSLAIRARLERQGTAAFIGTVRGALADSTGRSVARFEEPIAAYYSIEPRFTIPVKGLRPGTYRLRLELVSERPDIAPALLLHAAPVRDSVDVTLP